MKKVPTLDIRRYDTDRDAFVAERIEEYEREQNVPAVEIAAAPASPML